MSFKDQIFVVFRQMGSKGTPDEIFEHVSAFASEEDRDGWVRKGAIEQIRRALTAKDPETGLPFAPNVGETYIAAEQLEVDDYAYLIVPHRKRGDAAHERAHEYQVRCQDVHGVWLEVADAEDIVRRAVGE